MLCYKWSVFLCLFAFTWSPAVGWSWKTSDAIIQEVWPPEEVTLIKLKRASTSSISSDTKNVATIGDSEEDDSMLVFEGRYFKPYEVPPPPPFMRANNNWRGKSSQHKVKHKQPQTKSSGGYRTDTPVKVDTSKKPLPEKFTADNAKELPVQSSIRNKEEERSSSSNHKSVISSELTPLTDLREYAVMAGNTFQSSAKCFTATDAPGRCVPFRKCYPVVFNVIDGELRNPALAKLLYHSSGPCNATLELDFVLDKLKNDKTFFDPTFYNQSICCPGFKHPPTILASWEQDAKNISLPTHVKSNVGQLTLSSAENDGGDEVQTSINDNEGREGQLGVEDSSIDTTVEILQATEDDALDNDNVPNAEHVLQTARPDPLKDNFTVQAEKSDLEDENTDADDNLKEERRGDREKENSSADPFLSIASPNLSPNKCRHQIYGMPRGHWPWMVALVISSRHICSGALIDERHVLTAAHCVFFLEIYCQKSCEGICMTNGWIQKLEETELRKLRIIIGDRVMYSAVDGPHFWRKVTKVISHVNYNQQTFASDVAILKMNSDVPFSRNVQPISLSDLVSPFDFHALDKGIVAGWSGADIGQPAFEARMEIETVVEIIDKDECQETYRGFALSGIAKDTFCTRAANGSLCIADSGAPLIVRVRNCWVLAGIMSWGLGCSHFPEVYTDVTRYISWIRNHTT